MGMWICTTWAGMAQTNFTAEAQRKNYEMFGLNIYWDDLDEGIDLTAMLTGRYRRREPAEPVS